MSKSEVRRKTAEIRFRVAPDDLCMLRAKAADAGQTLPAYLVACGLARKTRSAMQDHIVQELRALGEQQRRLFHEGGGKSVMELSAIVAELVTAIRRIGA